MALVFTIPSTQTVTNTVTAPIPAQRAGSTLSLPGLLPSALKLSVTDILGKLPPVTIFRGFDKDGIPQFASHEALTGDEILHLVALTDEKGKPLLTGEDLDSLYQFVLMVIQMKFTINIINSSQADKISEEEINFSLDTASLSSSAASSSTGPSDTTSPDSQLSPPVLSDTERLYRDISTQHTNNFNDIIRLLKSKRWAIAEEAVHESPLLGENRSRIAIKILEMEQEPTVEEGSVVCKNQRCRSRKIMRQFVQTRSGDEGMTVFYSCVDCGLNF
jgi:DNA-directed RNA polymerase subunit M/transcription elongation factor TFIIS